MKRMSSPLCPPQASGGSSQIKHDDSRARLKTFSSLLLVVITQPFSLMLEIDLRVCETCNDFVLKAANRSFKLSSVRVIYFYFFGLLGRRVCDSDST